MAEAEALETDGDANVATVDEKERSVQNCVGELWGLRVRGDDGGDLPADDDSLGPSGRYVIYTTTVTTLFN